MSLSLIVLSIIAVNYSFKKEIKNKQTIDSFKNNTSEEKNKPIILLLDKENKFQNVQGRGNITFVSKLKSNAEAVENESVLPQEEVLAETESEVKVEPAAPQAVEVEKKETQGSGVKLGYNLQMLTNERYEQKKPMVSTFSLTKAFYIFILMLLIITLAIDTIIISKNKISRISGKSFVHASFFIIILISVLLSINGQVI